MDITYNKSREAEYNAIKFKKDSEASVLWASIKGRINAEQTAINKAGIEYEALKGLLNLIGNNKNLRVGIVLIVRKVVLLDIQKERINDKSESPNGKYLKKIIDAYNKSKNYNYKMSVSIKGNTKALDWVWADKVKTKTAEEKTEDTTEKRFDQIEHKLNHDFESLKNLGGSNSDFVNQIYAGLHLMNSGNKDYEKCLNEVIDDCNTLLADHVMKKAS